MKMTEELAKNGLFFDYLYNLRVLDPNIASETSDLKDKSGEYTEKLQEFRRIIDEFIVIAETIVNDVEQEKSHAIAAQNLLKSMAKQREAEQQDIQNETLERTMELEQLKVQLQYLQRIEANQQELIENFYENQ
ncbi:intraflagellar transport protein 20 homolog [Sitodiplosis mosellana]|uniref:intraflagellar transport protein 20 homolog n=1 Tax=Sitodiplosis mosellana TaxID=263140 RepID=UPI002443AB79|nr:intraflagellar transport protein 20 homolog [Sitodiplosis mosellana]